MKIEFKNVNFYYKKQELFNNLNLDLDPSNISVIIGQTGSGKSTMMEMMAGLLKPKSGEILIGDYVLNKKFKNKGEFPKDVNIVFQNSEDQMFEHTVYKDLMYGVKNFKLDQEQAHRDLKELFQTFNIDKDVINQDPLTLSGGQLKKMALISTLLLRPKVLLLDEPTIGLDELSKLKIMNYLKKHCKKHQIKIVLVTHDPDLICQFSDEIIMLKRGLIVYQGSKEQFLKYCFDNHKIDYLDDYNVLKYYTIKSNSSKLSKVEEIIC